MGGGWMILLFRPQSKCRFGKEWESPLKTIHFFRHVTFVFQFLNVFQVVGKCNDIFWKTFWSLIKMQFKNFSLVLCSCKYEHIRNLHRDVNVLILMLGSSGWELCTLIFWQNSSVPLLHNWALWVTSVRCIHRKKTWYFKFSSLPLGGRCVLNKKPLLLVLTELKKFLLNQRLKNKGHSGEQLTT